jgi:septum formation protein
MTRRPFVLASASPRRLQLLRQIGIEPTVVASGVGEHYEPGVHPARIVTELSYRKAASIVDRVDLAASPIIIGADTIVVLGDAILNKPSDATDAVKMLRTLSGRTHVVYTGICLLEPATRRCVCDYEATRVTFRDLEAGDIDAYAASGSPLDKAGAYGIQEDFGAVFVRVIDGCYYTVVGLPISKVHAHLSTFFA